MPVVEEPLFKAKYLRPGVFRELLITSSPVVTDGIKFFKVHRATALGSVEALRKANFLANHVEVVYDSDAVGFSVGCLYQVTSPLVDFFFGLVSLLQGVDTQRCLLAVEMFHPTGEYATTDHAME